MIQSLNTHINPDYECERIKTALQALVNECNLQYNITDLENIQCIIEKFYEFHENMTLDNLEGEDEDFD